MEQPSHNLRSSMGGTAAEATPRRLGGLVIVTLIHVGIAALLVLGMNAGKVEKKLEEIKATVEKDKTPPKTPPPPPPELVKPPPPFVPPPEFQIQTDAPSTNAITTTAVKPPPPQAPPAPSSPPPTKLEPIRSTFTLPPYPTISMRLGESGTTTLKIVISVDGKITDAQVQKSSGHERLDLAAIDWVKARYRYKPPTVNGQPTEASTLLNVVWNLKDAQ